MPGPVPSTPLHSTPLHSTPLRIVLVDDHEMVRQGLKAMLAPFRARIRVVGAAEDVERALPLVAGLDPERPAAAIVEATSSGPDVEPLADDGRGFDLTGSDLRGSDAAAVDETRTDGSGYGMRSMTERAELVGGSLRVRSRRGSGTTVTVTVPTG